MVAGGPQAVEGKAGAPAGLLDQGGVLHGLKDLLDTGQTRSNIGARGHATGVECPHRQLGSRFSDRLRRDNTNGFADPDHLVIGKIPTIAFLAHSVDRFAGQRRKCRDAAHALIHQSLDIFPAHDGALLQNGFAGLLSFHRVSDDPADNFGCQSLADLLGIGNQ